MVDVEEPKHLRNIPSRNTGLPHNHPVNVAYRILVIGGSIFGLHELSVFHQIMKGPSVSHEWFKVFLAASIGTYRCCVTFDCCRQIGTMSQPLRAVIVPFFI